ncbi:MAG: hypothetical protein M1833_003599 [Piccolia ochrophora]|nr:MAG: hypothetical protein M1833_003599 [Piccolia ochrophora]
MGLRKSNQPDQPEKRGVKQLLDLYRQKCISTCLLYPTFRSSAVIMTLGAANFITASEYGMDANNRCSDKLTAPTRVQSPAAPSRPRIPAFLRFWRTDKCRSVFLSHLPSADLASLRLGCHDFSVRAAPPLFANLTITFRPSTFTRPARMAALERIGHHVRTLTFCMPHTPESFLPPLLDPHTGEERVFVYQPQISCHDSQGYLTRTPKYGSSEMTDLLIQQYGPLFHAATNVPAFIRAFTAMRCISHLNVSCPGQDPALRYRRSAVDYALISLRIAVERSPLKLLSTLSLLPIHPGGLFYLRSMPAFGSSPSGMRRWAQVRKLAIHVDSWAFDAPNISTDHLKLLQDFLVPFSSNLERLFFRWKGTKGPCPFVLSSEPIVSAKKLKQRSRQTWFRRLRYFELANVTLHAFEVCSLINRHRRTLKECDFDEVDLRSGNWDEALAVLTTLSGNESWRDKQVLTPPPSRGSMCGTNDGEMPNEMYFGSPRHMKSFLRDSVMLSS